MTIRCHFQVAYILSCFLGEVGDESAQIRYHAHEPLDIFLRAWWRHVFNREDFLWVGFDTLFRNKLTKVF